MYTYTAVYRGYDGTNFNIRKNAPSIFFSYFLLQSSRHDRYGIIILSSFITDRHFPRDRTYIGGRIGSRGVGAAETTTTKSLGIFSSLYYICDFFFSTMVAREGVIAIV